MVNNIQLIINVLLMEDGVVGIIVRVFLDIHQKSVFYIYNHHNGSSLLQLSRDVKIRNKGKKNLHFFVSQCIVNAADTKAQITISFERPRLRRHLFFN